MASKLRGGLQSNFSGVEPAPILVGVASRLIASKGDPKDIKCLYHEAYGSPDGVGDYDPSLSPLQPESTHYGFATRRSDVYFTTCDEQHTG